MSTKKNANASATHTSKSRAKTALEVANLSKAATKGLSGKVLKYVYPKDLKDAADKKAFRRKARAAQRSFEKQLKALGKGTDAETVKQRTKLEKNYNSFKNSTYAK